MPLSRNSTKYSLRRKTMIAEKDTQGAGNTVIEKKVKKSVALSGVMAGNTAVCTVGRTGNDLHYRGYDITDLARHSTFEEVAYLLIYGELPGKSELKEYTKKLKSLRGLPAAVKVALESIPAAAHPMNVLQAGCSALSTVFPEKDDLNLAGARDIVDRLVASFGSMLIYWWHYSQSGRRIEVETDDDTVAGHFLHILHGRKPSPEHVRALDISLILYAEHEFTASTFTARVITGGGSRNSAPLPHGRRGGNRYHVPRCEEGDHHRLRAPGLHGGRPQEPHHQGAGGEPLPYGRQHAALLHRGPHRGGHDAGEEDVRQP
jgi:hypothetical protein